MPVNLERADIYGSRAFVLEFEHCGNPEENSGRGALPFRCPDACQRIRACEIGITPVENDLQQALRRSLAQQVEAHATRQHNHFPFRTEHPFYAIGVPGVVKQECRLLSACVLWSFPHRTFASGIDHWSSIPPGDDLLTMSDAALRTQLGMMWARGGIDRVLVSYYIQPEQFEIGEHSEWDAMKQASKNRRADR